MNRLHSLPERALELVGQAGDELRQMVPAQAGKWLDAGIKLGAIKTGGRIAQRFLRRNPAALAAAAAGAGVLWYVARRRAQQAERGPIEGQATRVEAKRANGKSSSRSGTNGAAAKRTRKPRAGKSTSTSS